MSERVGPIDKHVLDLTFADVCRHGSCVVVVAWLLMLPTSFVHWLFREIWHRWSKEPPPSVVEIWLLILLLLQGLCLFWWMSPGASWLLAMIPAFGLYDSFGALLRDLMGPVAHRDCRGGYIVVRGVTRWLLTGGACLLMVVFCFASLFLWLGGQFKPDPITDAVTAIYQSALTLTTLGYGDFHPASGCSLLRVLVFLELLFFVMFLGIRLPIAASAMRVVERWEGGNAKQDNIGPGSP